MAGVTLKIDRRAVRAKLNRRVRENMAPLVEQMLADCNEFVREDQGTLRKSSYIASRPADGLLIWDTKYAKKVYYTGTPSKDANPGASLRWVEKAKRTYGKSWAALATRLMRG